MPSVYTPPKLNNDQIADLYSKCIQLSEQNKINQKNTWSLNLIPYIQEVINDPNMSTNYAKLGITIGASIKIYSTRVDSAHSQTHEVCSSLFSNTTKRKRRNQVPGETETSFKQYRPTIRRKETLSSNSTDLNMDFQNLDDSKSNLDKFFVVQSQSYEDGNPASLFMNMLDFGTNDMLLLSSNDLKFGEDAFPSALEQEFDFEELASPETFDEEELSPLDTPSVDDIEPEFDFEELAAPEYFDQGELSRSGTTAVDQNLRWMIDPTGSTSGSFDELVNMLTDLVGTGKISSLSQQATHSPPVLKKTDTKTKSKKTNVEFFDFSLSIPNKHKIPARDTAVIAKRKIEPEKYLIKENPAFSIKDFGALFLRPKVLKMVKSKATGLETELGSDSGFDSNYTDDDDDYIWESQDVGEEQDLNDDLIFDPLELEGSNQAAKLASKMAQTKETVHEAIQILGDVENSETTIAFDNMIQSIHANNIDGTSTKIGIPLYFMALLHLANEEGLEITSNENLDNLFISK